MKKPRKAGILYSCQFLVFLALSFVLHGVDCNDRPSCDQTFYTTKFDEGPGDGEVVFTYNCDDEDSGPEGELTYTLSDGGKGQFRVDSLTGNVIVEGVSDAERLFESTGQLANPYTLSIIVADKGSPPYSTPVTVLVDIASVNDNTPRIEDLPVSVNVSETEAVGKVLSTCTLVDDDVDHSDHGTAYVRIKSGNEASKFVLNQLNCDLMLISPLDYETAPSYTLTLEAYDLDPVNPKSSTQDILIEVEDVNDFTPACVGYNILREVSESSPVATTLTTLDCIDKDGGQNGQIEFKVNRGDPKLTVDKTSGNVSLVEPLDFEAGDDLLEMEVIVYDLGTPSFSSSVTVVFKVKDADDNPPQWTEPSFNATISESTLVGSIVIALSATDLDTPKSDLSKITYGLEELCEPDWFLVDEQIGSVVVKAALDWETSNLITCRIHAFSSDQFDDRTITNMTISLTDVNDRAPIFDKFLFTGSVREDAPTGTSVLTVEADDPDGGINGEFVVSMPNDSPFSIDPNTGELTLASTIDYEDVTTYLLTVVAKDKGYPTQSSLTYVNIQVEPVNEFDPTLSPGISLTVSEDTEPGTALTTMSADDQDAGLDGEVEFFLLESDVPFLLETVTGDLRIGIGLDREIKDVYSLDILVRDKSNTTIRYSQSTIQVTVTDVNDNAPECDPITPLQIGPPFSSIDPVVQIQCSDQDVGNTISYTLVGGDIHGIFAVNSANGKIFLVGSPIIGSYILYVDVEDNGTPNLKITLPVPIAVENEFKFENLPVTLEMWENTTIFSPVYTVNTSGSWDFVSTEIVSGNDDKLFNLNPTSREIRLVRVLDWETKPSHMLKIRAVSSNGQLIEDDLIIDVIDVNDDVPRFDDTFVHIKVVETVAVPALLSTITATDKDEGVSSEIDYSIFTGNETGMFGFNELAEFRLLNRLDYEKRMSYSVIIQAQDRGDPSLSSTGVLFIEVVNQDDNPLMVDFVDSVGHFNLSEDTAVGTLVTVVNGSDADTGSNIQYTIISGNDLRYFTIDRNNGTIYTATSLDYESVHSVVLEIEAENSMGVSEILTLNIQLLDVNDNTPTFSKLFYSTELPHGTLADKIIGEVTVTDLDSTDNGLVSLSIQSGNDKNHFRLSGNNLETVVELDSVVQDFYTLVIKAMDAGNPVRSSSAVFQIVVDEKLLKPQFSSTLEELTLQEDRAPGTIFDCDATIAGAVEGEQGDLVYTIVNGNDENYFFINPFTCKIDLVKTLVYGSTSTFSLQLLASNEDNSKLNDSLTINVNVSQLNKHTPIFEQEIYTWSIPEDSDISTVIGSVLATDEDIGDFGEVIYFIESNSKFDINSSSGLIKTVDQFDYRLAQSYHVHVIAKDKGTTITRSSSAIVVIDIVDINNHVPSFSSPNYEIDIPESTETPVDIYVISAKDDDTGNGGEIQYSITSGDTSLFEIHQSLGVLNLLSSLDYETQTKYVLEITARDQGTPSFSSTATLTINVIDSNDNIPVFPFQRIDLAVSMDAPPFTPIYTVMATDIDDGVKDSTINYAILDGNTKGLFTINMDTGEIKTVRHVTADDASYALVVIAKDQGIPPLTGSATVGVSVMPGGASVGSVDYSFSMGENEPNGAFVGKIPSDPGLDEISYSISSGNYNDDLIITTSKKGDGTIYTTRSLDRETYSLYQLVVTLQHTTGVEYLIVSVSVTDTNDHDPVPEVTAMTLEVVENTPTGTILTTIAATDADTGLNGDLNFGISDSTPLGQRHFALDASNGVLTVKETIDYEIFQSLEFVVEVADKGSQSRTVSVTVSVTVRDVVEEEITADSDESPSTFKSFEIPHNLKRGDQVFVAEPGYFNFSLDASDSVFYTSVGSNVFALDSGSGIVSLELDSLLYASSSYLQWIVCTSSNSSKLAMIRIDTFDANEHMIALVVSLDISDLELQREALITRLQSYFSPQNVVKIWAIEATASSSNRRRLLASESAALVVVLEDDTADDVGNVDQAKNFLTQTQLLAALQSDPSGTPVAGLSDATIPITHVVAYVNGVSDATEAHPANVAFYFIIALAAIVVLVLIGALTAYYIIQYRKSKGSLTLKDKDSDEERLVPSVDEDEQLHDQQERAFMLMGGPLPKGKQLAPLETAYGNHPFHSYRPPSRAIKTRAGLLPPVVMPPLDTAKLTSKKEEVTKKPKRRTKSIPKRSKKKAVAKKPSVTFVMDDPFRVVDEELDTIEIDGRKKMMRSLAEEQLEKGKQLLLRQEDEKRQRVANAKARRKMSEGPQTVQPNGLGLFKPKKVVKNAWRSPKSSNVETPTDQNNQPDVDSGDTSGGLKKSPYEERFPRPYRDKLLLQQHDQAKDGVDVTTRMADDSDQNIDRRKSFAGFGRLTTMPDNTQ